MKNSAVLFDTLFTFAAVFFAALFISDWFLRDARVFPFAVTAALFVSYFVLRRHRKKPLRKAPDTLDALLNKFVFSPPEYALSFSRKALERKGTVQRKNKLLRVGTTAFYPCFLPEPLTAANVTEGYARAVKLGAKRLVILSAYGAASETAALAARLQDPQTEVWDFARVYAFFCYLGHPPTQTLRLKSQKKRFALKDAVARPKAIKYVFTATVLLFFARFAPFAPLYAVTAAVCFTLALVCLFLSHGTETHKKHKKRE
ncbi:MAG: hypothetical protein K2M95_07985 [Clostridiales bacterium]|nr:hypothetical protein [Clostridiales bacterium]